MDENERERRELVAAGLPDPCERRDDDTFEGLMLRRKLFGCDEAGNPKLAPPDTLPTMLPTS